MTGPGTGTRPGPAVSPTAGPESTLSVADFVGALGRRLGGTGDAAVAVRRRAVAERLAERGVAATAAGGDAAVVDRFVERARAGRAETVRTVAAGLGGVVAAILDGVPDEAPVRVADHPWLAGLGEGSNRGFLTGAAEGGDAVGITVAACAIAETGAVVVTSAPETPTLLAFLPRLSVVIVGRSAVVPRYEDAFARIARGGAMPRNLDFILGPSRTGDIEEELLIGVHGPHRVVIVVVEDL